MNSSLVSIIIPTYNRAHLIIDTLDSVLTQTYKEWECIVVDDGSTDNTKEVMGTYLKKDKRIQYYQRPKEKKKGANACRNYGMKIAKGDYLIFMDSDDIFIDKSLEIRVNYFEKNKHLDMLVFSMGLFSDKKKLRINNNRKVFNASLDKTIYEFIIGDKIPWSTSRPIYKSSLIKNKIAFNEDLPMFQDVEFSIRLLKILKPKYLSIDITESYYRDDENAQKRYFKKKFIDKFFLALTIYYKVIFKLLNTQEKKNIKKKLILKYFILIKTYYRGHNNDKNILNTIKLLKKELGISHKKRLGLYLIYGLNKFFFNKKGYFYFQNKLKKMLN